MHSPENPKQYNLHNIDSLLQDETELVWERKPEPILDYVREKKTTSGRKCTGRPNIELQDNETLYGWINCNERIIPQRRYFVLLDSDVGGENYSFDSTQKSYPKNAVQIPSITPGKLSRRASPNIYFTKIQHFEREFKYKLVFFRSEREPIKFDTVNWSDEGRLIFMDTKGTATGVLQNCHQYSTSTITTIIDYFNLEIPEYMSHYVLSQQL